ncbi:MAG: hypothetical protein LW629_08540 [Burkholderiales bacterium]|jgi:hypothetical protein|nr:hypothetical protein [Burkholderiales bacterium]
MKNVKNILKFAAVSIIAAVGFSQPAHAQKGSRLCGWVANYQTQTGPQALAFLYEIRTADASDGRQCSEFISKVYDKAIKSNAQLSQLPFQKVEKATCESVGSIFIGAQHPSNDMCDYMEAKKPFQVQKSLVNNVPTTVYTKIDI